MLRMHSRKLNYCLSPTMTGQLNLNALENLPPWFRDWNSNVPAMGRSATGLCIGACTLSQLFVLITFLFSTLLTLVLLKRLQHTINYRLSRVRGLLLSSPFRVRVSNKKKTQLRDRVESPKPARSQTPLHTRAGSGVGVGGWPLASWLIAI